MTFQLPRLIRTSAILLNIVLATIILSFGKTFLAPLCFAALLAMLLLPMTRWLEGKRISKAIATSLSVIALVGFFSGIIFLIGWQASSITEDSAKLKTEVSKKYNQLQDFINEKFGIDPERQHELIKQQQNKSEDTLASVAAGFAGVIVGFLANILLVAVYIFLLLYSRDHLRKFVIRLMPQNDEASANDAINKIQKVTQKYLTGLSLMIASLWVMYGIGFSIVGVKHAIFFAILCGVLELVPFLGNFVGNSLTILMAVIQGGSTNMILGILIVYGVVQFVQSYLLQPLVVGSEVNINPLFTIVGLIAGNIIWGITGMVLVIPLLAIFKIICDHINPLKPYGELIGNKNRQDKNHK